ncbi:hypothetical protein RHSIM_Rhsim03G0098200 [Rhododendron simsii]|uniref:Uncharacterized protein n=1 Tax=Rhododendron simsii TaxID=118357 RepID=A0A834HDJ9_RHOSS|nr:hypothetical protein RHSIM_Rhsim03G0098200 [Rhododendron simsii]
MEIQDFSPPSKIMLGPCSQVASGDCLMFFVAIAEAGEDDTGVVIMARGKRFGNSACDEDAVDGEIAALVRPVTSALRLRKFSGSSLKKFQLSCHFTTAAAIGACWRGRKPELDDALLYWGGFEAGTRGGAAAVFGPWFAGFPGRLGGSKWRCLVVIDGIQYVGLMALWVFVLGA